MTADDAIKIIKLLEENEIEVYIDGGWGVDALLGEQTRAHNDLDIALPHKFVPKLCELLKERGFTHVPTGGSWECNYVLGDNKGRLVDFHSYIFDENGKNVFGVAYELQHLSATGLINGHGVKCVTAEASVEFHTGYEVDENDYCDVKALCRRFNIPMPKIYDKFEER